MSCDSYFFFRLSILFITNSINNNKQKYRKQGILDAAFPGFPHCNSC